MVEKEKNMSEQIETPVETQEGSGSQDVTQDGQQQQSEAKFDLSNLDPAVQGYIKSLRKEAASYRTSANQLKTQFEDLQGRLQSVFGEEEQADPAQVLQELQGQTQSLQFKNAVLEMAVQNAIPASGIPYFQFLLNQATDSLGEGEELDSEAMESIIAEARAKSAPVMQSSSVATPSHAPQAKADITVDKFAKMGMADRTALYRNNPDKYSELMAAWKKTIR